MRPALAVCCAISPSTKAPSAAAERARAETVDHARGRRKAPVAPRQEAGEIRLEVARRDKRPGAERRVARRAGCGRSTAAGFVALQRARNAPSIGAARVRVLGQCGARREACRSSALTR